MKHPWRTSYTVLVVRHRFSINWCEYTAAKWVPRHPQFHTIIYLWVLARHKITWHIISKQRFRKYICIPSGLIERLPFMQRTVAVSSSGVTGCTLNSPVTTLGKRTGSGETPLVGREAATDAAVDTPMSAKYLFRASQPIVGSW